MTRDILCALGVAVLLGLALIVYRRRMVRARAVAAARAEALAACAHGARRTYKTFHFLNHASWLNWLGQVAIATSLYRLLPVFFQPRASMMIRTTTPIA